MADVPVRDAAAARIAVIAFAILQILTPLLPWLGIGQPIGERSDNVNTLITPAGWAFSIWGALYTGAIVFAIYQAVRDNRLLQQIRWPAAGAFLGNALWAAYTQSYGLGFISVLIILFTLVCLLVVYRHFLSWRSFSTPLKWLVFLPLSALTAWLTAATIVNIAASLRFHGVEAGDAAPVVAAAVVVVGGLIATFALYRSRGNPPFALVFLWALAGIYAGGAQGAPIVAAATGISAVLVVLGWVSGLRQASARVTDTRY